MTFLLQNRTINHIKKWTEIRHKHGMKETCLSFSNSTYHLFAYNITVIWGDFDCSRVFYMDCFFWGMKTPPKTKKTFPCIRFVHKAIDKRPQAAQSGTRTGNNDPSAQVWLQMPRAWPQTPGDSGSKTLPWGRTINSALRQEASNLSMCQVQYYYTALTCFSIAELKPQQTLLQEKALNKQLFLFLWPASLSELCEHRHQLLPSSWQCTGRHRSGEVGLGNHILVCFKIKTDSKFFSQLNASGTSCMWCNDSLRLEMLLMHY